MGEAKRRQLNGEIIPASPFSSAKIDRAAAEFAARYNNTCANDETRSVFAKEVRDLIRIAIRAEGLKAFESTQESAAAHEAGHVVIAGLYGERATHCYINSQHHRRMVMVFHARSVGR